MENEVMLKEELIHCNSCDTEKMHIMILHNPVALGNSYYRDLNIYACKKCGSTRIIV